MPKKKKEAGEKAEALVEKIVESVDEVVEAVADIVVNDEEPPPLDDLPPPNEQVFEVKQLIAEVAGPAVLPSLWKRVDTKDLYPPFFKKLEKLVAACEKRGVRYYPIEGYRSPQRQNELYAQGRSKPGKVVTRDKAWQSIHQYHGAVDFCRDANVDRAGLQPDWDLESYEVLAQEAKKLGLEAAYYWKGFKEGPHVQMPLSRYGITLERMRDIYVVGGRKALFALFDKFEW